MSELLTAARPYARAVFELAQSESAPAAWSDALVLMSALVAHDDMRVMLDSPKLGADKKAQLLVDVCEGKLKPTQQNLLRTLAENDRFALLPDIAALYEVMRAEAESKIEATVKSAHPLSDAQKQAIIAALKKKLGREVTRIVHTEGVKVGRELIQAREDWEAARDYHALMGNDVSERILGNSEALVSDLTDEARELLVLSRDLSRKAKASWIGKSVDDHGH